MKTHLLALVFGAGSIGLTAQTTYSDTLTNMVPENGFMVWNDGQDIYPHGNHTFGVGVYINFAERYDITLQNAKILGVVSYLEGFINAGDGSTEVTFQIWGSSGNGPVGLLAEKGLPCSQLVLNTAPTLDAPNVTMFDTPLDAPSSFYVGFFTGDYYHGAFSNGSSFGLCHSEEGARETNGDLGTSWRNALAGHNHSPTAPPWKDIYVDAFSVPVDVYLAMHPIVQFESPLGIEEQVVSRGSLSVKPVYPNPVQNEMNIAYELDKAEDMTFELLDFSGRVVKTVTQKAVGEGNHTQKMDVNDLAAGNYLLNVKAGQITSLVQSINITK